MLCMCILYHVKLLANLVSRMAIVNTVKKKGLSKKNILDVLNNTTMGVSKLRNSHFRIFHWVVWILKKLQYTYIQIY